MGIVALLKIGKGCGGRGVVGMERIGIMSSRAIAMASEELLTTRGGTITNSSRLHPHAYPPPTAGSLLSLGSLGWNVVIWWLVGEIGWKGGSVWVESQVVYRRLLR